MENRQRAMHKCMHSRGEDVSIDELNLSLETSYDIACVPTYAQPCSRALYPISFVLKCAGRFPTACTAPAKGLYGMQL